MQCAAPRGRPPGVGRDDAVSAGEELRVAFQGEPGAYSEEAAHEALDAAGREIRTLPRPAFSDVFDAVARGEADLGIVPIENSMAGSVRDTFDLLLERDLPVVGESYLRVRHCLMALPGTSAADLEVVLSHRQALAQCASTLEETVPGAVLRPAPDTAGSARRIRREELASTGALASERAARVHDLRVLRRGMEDEPGNSTRFLLLGREPVEAGAEAKTSVAFSGPNEPGLLHRCLAVFARRGIDLTRIESRPLRGASWEYVFYVDFADSTGDDRVQSALEELRGTATMVKVLGSYPRGTP